MVDYDFIMDGDWSHRAGMIERLTPEERAELLKIHRQRWLDANRHRLSVEQIQMLEEEMAFIVPELYRQPADPAMKLRAKELERRAIELLDRHDVYDLTIHGHRVPLERREKDFG